MIATTQQVETALRAIPDQEKTEYLQALRIAPFLVAKESDPAAFLRYTHGNAVSAARRLVAYWRFRVQVFGEARAFLPLVNDFSGNGALGRNEVDIIRDGGAVLLPNDVHGRPICLGNRGALSPRLQQCPDAIRRANFWVIQQMTYNPISQTSGAVLIVRYPSNLSCADDVTKKTRDLLREAFPLHVHGIHLIYFQRESRSLMQSVRPFFIEHFGRFFFRKTIVHNFKSNDQAVEKLARHGITRESFSRSMGGLLEAGCVAPAADPTARSALVSGGSVKVGEYQQLQSEEDPLSEAGVLTVRESIPLSSKVSPLEPAAQTSVADSLVDTEMLDLVSLSSQDSLMDSRLIQSQSSKQQPVEPFPLPAALDDDDTLLDIDATMLFSEMPDAAAFGATAPGGNGDLDFLLDDTDAALLHDTPETADLFGIANDSPHDPKPICLPPHQQQQLVVNHNPVGPAFKSQQEQDLRDTDMTFVEESPTDVSGPIRLQSQQQQQHQQLVVNHDPVGPAFKSEQDLHDTDMPFVEPSAKVPERSLDALNEALKGLPAPDQEAYNEAVQRAPHLVQSESNPLSYLRFENFDTWAAAKRLALYWKYRVESFGDRAFLPLTQTKDGALWEEDLRNLATGYLFFLPADSSGRPVLCCDLSKRPEDATDASRVRVAMYFFSLLWRDNIVSTTEGCVVLHLVSTESIEMSKFDETTRKTTDIAIDSFPIRNYETHVIYSSSSPTASPERSFMVFVLPVLLHAMARLLSHRVHFHVGETGEELERKLGACGLSGAGLQAAVMGGIRAHDFSHWIQQRQILESRPCTHHQRPLPPSPSTAAAGSAGMLGNTKSPPRSSGAPVVNAQDINSAMELVSVSEKSAYLEAMKVAPEVVKKETDPAWFLKSENYNTLAAARRLAAHWRIRLEIFGERAFLPMDQTTDGALDRRDIAVLHTGFLTQLPNDAAGHSVICCDGSRFQKSSRSSQLRTFFYVWSVVSRTDCYSVLYTMGERSFDRACKECLDLVLEAYPTKLKCFHLLGSCPSGVSPSDFHQGPVRDTMKLLDRSIQQDKFCAHVCESRGGFARKLECHGMPKDGLPTAFGGKWGLRDFVQWQELRVRREWDLPIRGSLQDRAKVYSIATPDVPPLASLNGDEKTERNRRLNVIHSRRKRERSRIDVQVLQEQCGALREEQKELLRVGRELEELLQRAEATAKGEKV